MNDINVFTHEYVNNRLKPYRSLMGGIAVPVNAALLEDIYFVAVKNCGLYESKEKRLHLIAKRLANKIENLVSDLPEKEIIMQHLTHMDIDYLAKFQDEKNIMLLLTEAEAVYLSIELMLLNGVPRVNFCTFQKIEYAFVNIDAIDEGTSIDVVINSYIDYKFLYYAGMAAAVGYRDKFQTIEAKMVLAFYQYTYHIMTFDGEPTYEDNCYRWLLADAPSFCCRYNPNAAYFQKKYLLNSEELAEYDSYFLKNPHEVWLEQKEFRTSGINPLLLIPTTDVFGINNFENLA